MINNRKGIIYGALIGDAIALGPHWIYDMDKIERHFGTIEGFRDPDATQYHPSKKAGDFTHYGDQMLHLVDTLAEEEDFDPISYKEKWLEFVDNNDMYMDGATKNSIEPLKEKGVVIGSSSNDLAGYSISIGLYSLDNPTLDDFKRRIKLTHYDEDVLMAGEFFYKAIKEILEGKELKESLYNVKKEMNKDFIDKVFKKVEEHLDDDYKKAIKNLGQSCHVNHAFPSILYLLIKYADDLNTGLIHNVYAGGDSAARGMIIGMFLGAIKGYEGLPSEWIDNLNKKPEGFNFI